MLACNVGAKIPIYPAMHFDWRLHPIVTVQHIGGESETERP